LKTRRIGTIDHVLENRYFGKQITTTYKDLSRDEKSTDLSPGGKKCTFNYVRTRKNPTKFIDIKKRNRINKEMYC